MAQTTLTRVMKRTYQGNGTELETREPKRVLVTSAAAKFNVAALRKLQKALEKDPEVDLSTALPAGYCSRLAGRKLDQANGEIEPQQEEIESADPPVFQPALPTSPAEIVHPLSDAVKALLEVPENGPSSTELTINLGRLLNKSEIVWHSSTSTSRYVAKCSSDVVVKCISSKYDFTEYTTLQFLRSHAPRIPVPEPHGLIVSGELAFLFMTCVAGSTMDTIWPELGDAQKTTLSLELNDLLLELRQIPRPAGMALGGVAGEGCKDTRRHTRSSHKPIQNPNEFWEFQYSTARAGSPVFLQFLRNLTSPLLLKAVVFTHGDLRPENIMVDRDADGEYRITGLVDWEMSGFYPEDFECTKITNTLATNEKTDWYLHLPACVSPAVYPARWFSDRIWDKHVV